MRFDILTLFPGFFDSPLKESIIGKAVAKGVVEVVTHNIRDYATDRHRTTDDYPYGGGPGMVMKVEPVVRAIESLCEKGRRPRVILTTPQGRVFNQSVAEDLANEERIAILCGRYEGFDERIREFVDLELSAGDYILTGGELPALTIIDAVSRLIPGVLGHVASKDDESFSGGLLEYPQYTRPEEFRGMVVPSVLLSGNHAEIQKWRRAQSLERTAGRRPDLLEGADLTPEERESVENSRNR